MTANRAPRTGAENSAAGTSDHSISIIEAIAYTLLILFVACLAMGWFDLMIPWGVTP